MADIRGQGSDLEGPYSPDRAGATNLSIHPGKPMDVRDHPARNIPNATEHYDGSQDNGFAKKYMQGMNTLASGTSKTAGQYGAESAQNAEDYTRKLVGLDD